MYFYCNRFRGGAFTDLLHVRFIKNMLDSWKYVPVLQMGTKQYRNSLISKKFDIYLSRLVVLYFF